MSAFEKTISAVKPIRPGSRRRKGTTEALNGVPKTTGIRGGASAAPTSRLASVTHAADRKAFSVSASRGSAALRAASGRSAVETAPGK